MTMPLPARRSRPLVDDVIQQWDACCGPVVASMSADLAVVQVAIARNMTREQASWGVLFASGSTAVIVAAVPFFILQRSYVRVVAVQADK